MCAPCMLVLQAVVQVVIIRNELTVGASAGIYHFAHTTISRLKMHVLFFDAVLSYALRREWLVLGDWLVVKIVPALIFKWQSPIRGGGP